MSVNRFAELQALKATMAERLKVQGNALAEAKEKYGTSDIGDDRVFLLVYDAVAAITPDDDIAEEDQKRYACLSKS